MWPKTGLKYGHVYGGERLPLGGEILVGDFYSTLMLFLFFKVSKMLLSSFHGQSNNNKYNF